ncbi:hydroxyacid dehydrogenase, partial [Salmonella enterica subsp. enterica serovar Typhimurium]|uniref:four-carbon acid sugar kinase family protein n=1 Tax=Salmonella enterica TaxID=28901 RepID=UPI000CA68C16
NETLGNTADVEIKIPFFKEGGRYTINNIHYVETDGELVPAAETEFAKDRTFGFTKSHLGEYVEEKSAGAYKKEDVTYIDLDDLR